MWSKSAHSEPLATNISDDSDDTKYESHRNHARSKRRERLFKVVPWVAHFVLLLISTVLFFRANQLYQNCQTWSAAPTAREYGPVASEVGRGVPHTLHGDFFAQSIYRGPPKPELDAAWKKLGFSGSVAIPRADMVRMEKLVPSSAQLPEEPVEMYQSGLEVFHQLHCLNMIRKYIYPDYYSFTDESFTTDMNRVHADHCVDILRQHLMCDADLHTYTYNWVDRTEHAWPDFSTTKMCRNWDDVLEWGVQHAAHTSAKGGMVLRPENASVLHQPSDDELRALNILHN